MLASGLAVAEAMGGCSAETPRRSQKRLALTYCTCTHVLTSSLCLQELLCLPWTTYGVLGPYKIERYAKLPQRSKIVTTGLGSIKTTWIRVYSASNRLLGLENGWPFRRFGGGAAPPPSPLSPLDAQPIYHNAPTLRLSLIHI